MACGFPLVFFSENILEEFELSSVSPKVVLVTPRQHPLVDAALVGVTRTDNGRRHHCPRHEAKYISSVSILGMSLPVKGCSTV